jgi:hypothetical protein
MSTHYKNPVQAPHTASGTCTSAHIGQGVACKHTTLGWMAAVCCGTIAVLASGGFAQAESMSVSTLYTQGCDPRNAVHWLWTPVQHLHGKTFVVVPDATLRPLVTQIDADGKITTVPLDPLPDYHACADGHNRFTLGIDKDGYLHIAGDMHGYAEWATTYIARYQYQNMMYWRSNRPLDVTGGFTFTGGATAETRLPGEEWGGDSRFFNDRNGELYFSSRVRAFTGSTLSGSEPFIAYGLYRYDTNTGRWTAMGGDVSKLVPDAQNFHTVLYWEHTIGFEAFQTDPVFDSHNRLHFAISGNAAELPGMGLIYAMSDDGGVSWKKANGTRIPGLPLRNKDGDPDQADLLARASSIEHPSVTVDQDGKFLVQGHGGQTWNGSAWVHATGNGGFLGPDGMLTCESGPRVLRSAGIDKPAVAFDYGIGTVFSISELGLMVENVIYAVSIPSRNSVDNNTSMSVIRAEFSSVGDIAQDAAVSASSGTPNGAFEHNGDSKWFTGQEAPGWLRCDFPTNHPRLVLRYVMESGNDMPVRDPKDWILEGSQDGTQWTALDKRSGETFTKRNERRAFVLATPARYAHFRLNISSTRSTGQGLQLSKLELIGIDASSVPEAPRIYFCQNDKTTVWLSWTKSNKALSYTVKRAASQDGPYKIIASGVTKCGEFVDPACILGKQYFYTVCGVSPIGTGPDSKPVSITPQLAKKRPPIIMTALGCNAHIVLNWLPLWADGMSYNVKRASSATGPFSTIASAVKGLTYSDTGLVNDQPYFYVISAVNATGGESADSAPIKGSPYRWVSVLKYKSIGYHDKGTASASAENPPNESADKAFDHSRSRWLMPANTGWLQYTFAPGEKWAVTRYKMITSQDATDRDPKDWQFQGSNDNKNWVTLDTQSNQTFPHLSNSYHFENHQAFPMYRLYISKNQGSGLTQLSELELWVDGEVLPQSTRH